MNARGKRTGKMLRDMGDGLVLRRGRRADTEALAGLYREVFCGPEGGDPPEAVTAWTRDLMEGRRPGIGAGDFTVVEDTGNGQIVSGMCLVPQVWSYAGVRLPVGQPELVATKKEYRRKGLIRAQFDTVHEWSARRGQALQVIGGIPNFYRQFGYEMGLGMGGGRAGAAGEVPKLKRGTKEPFRVRPARESDVPFIRRVYRRGMERYLVSTVRTPEVWAYEMTGRRRQGVDRHELRVIERAAGEAVGFLAHAARLRGTGISLCAYELKAGVSWLEVTPSVMRYLAAAGAKYAAREKKTLTWVGLWLSSEHPACEVAAGHLRVKQEPYAFFVRVPDMVGFLRRIAPVLERRLAESVAVGYTGELTLSFYRDGVKLVFRKGRLAKVEAWAPGQPESGESAAFTGLTFLHLLFGHRSMDELGRSFADCYGGSHEAWVLMDILFPKRPSWVWSVM